MAHIMNLVVHDGIKESIVSIERIRQTVRYIRQSPASAIEYESTILEYADHDIGLSHHLELVDIVDGSPAGILLSSDWEDIKKLTKFLEILYKLTLKNMKEKFDKYWGDPEKMNKMIFISWFLDPWYKFDSVSFALAKMFEEKGPIIAKEVHTYMTSLFDEYVKSHSKDKELKRHKAGIGGSDSKSELEKYLTEEVENEIAGSNILLWWKVNSPRFPILGEMAQNVLFIPISSVASECAFSTGKRILDSFKSSLTPKLVEVLVCLQDWLRSEPLPVSVEEDLDVLEQLEQGVTMPRLCGLKAISHVWSHYERIVEGDDGWWKDKLVLSP
ncbi:zinc finger BED domain-containing protein RICESLEEPER 2-like [Nicotiana tabacum]|uniref:Zinc finger BED domain-containing protein RICESLEEPER 2-like n=1 Tax=Nicotiana tabacum TaxID=4097 RepID=A0AC58RX71_TOBAC